MTVHVFEGLAIVKMWGTSIIYTLNGLLYKGFKFFEESNCSHVLYIKAVLRISSNPATEPVLMKLLQSFTNCFETKFRESKQSSENLGNLIPAGINSLKGATKL